MIIHQAWEKNIEKSELSLWNWSSFTIESLTLSKKSQWTGLRLEGTMSAGAEEETFKLELAPR